jgi:parallel beta-helix repeat protein
MLSLGATANVHVNGLTITRAAAGAYTNTGLSITSPAPNATRFGNITIHDVVMAGAWLTGINVIASLVSLDHVLVLMANATGGGPGVGIRAAGVDDANYLVELTLNDVETIGGNVGLLIGTWVQGVYVTQSRFIGNDYGIRWDGVSGHGDLWLAVSNTHFNSGTRGLLTFNGMSPQVVNTYSLHFGIPAVGGVYAAFECYNIGPGLFSNNSIYCAGTASPSAAEYGIYLNGGNNVTVVGNFISMPKSAGIYVAVTDRTLIASNNFGLDPGVPAVQYGAGRAASNQEYGNQLNGVPDLQSNAAGLTTGTANNPGTQVTIKGGANTNRMLAFTTNDNTRWFFGVDGSIAEGAGNAGGDLAIISAGDAGLIEKMFSIKRSTGVLSLSHPITFGGSLTQAVDDAAAALGNVPVGGMYRNGSALQIRVT